MNHQHVLLTLALQFVVSATIIIIAGGFLAKAADAIAETTRLGRLLVGSILLAGATSLPELLVDVHAIQQGMPDLAVGDLLGSSLANLLILAVADLLHQSKTGMFSRQGGVHALSGAMSINMTALAGASVLIGDRLGGLEFAGVGVAPWFVALAYILGLRLVFHDQRARAQGPKDTSSLRILFDKNLGKQLLLFLVCATAIFFAAPYLAHSAGGIAEQTGLGKTFVGTTLLALSTSLPEAVSTIAAIRMGAVDLAIANIYGSNAFNMLLLVPLDMFHKGSLMASVSKAHLLTCLAVIVGTSVAVMGQLYQVETRKRFLEPDAFVIIALITGTLLLLFRIGV